MPRSTLAAIALFVANTVVAGGFLWEARPRTVSTLDAGTLLPREHAALLRLIADEDVDPGRVRVCTARPCTRGPALFIVDGTVRRLELPRSSRPGPLAGGRP